MEELYHYGVKGMKWRHHKPSEDSERRDKENRKKLAQKKQIKRNMGSADKDRALYLARRDVEKAEIEKLKSKAAQVGDGKYTNAYVERQNLRDRAERANGGVARKKQANTSHRAKALRRERSRRRGLEYVKRYQSSSYKKV
jgi:hypothetical protein